MATRQQQSRPGYSGSLLALENDPRFSSGTGGMADSLLWPTFQSQYWYDRRIGSVLPGSSFNVSTGSYQTSKVMYVPCFLPKALAIDALGMASGATGASGGIIRIGTYTCTTAGLPSALINDFGQLTLSPNPSTTVTLAASGTLPKGWFYFALSVNNVNPGNLVSVTSNTQDYPQPGFPNSSGFNYSTVVTTPISWPQFYVETGTANAAALNASVGTLTGNFTSALSPNVWFKVA